MSAPLVSIAIASIYKNSSGVCVNVPNRMASCPPDMRASLLRLSREVTEASGSFRLSDLFRSYEMQLQAHLDYKSGKKRAFSPPPGSSMHESGRAFDVDVAALGMPLATFWAMAAKHGVVPIIARPDTALSECWHFECRGSHELVRRYYASGKAANLKPSQAMAASAILAAGIRVDSFKHPTMAAIQSALIRLGQDVGPMDGLIGRRTIAALEACGVRLEDDHEAILAALELQLQVRFPDEWDTTGTSFPMAGTADEAVFWSDYNAPDYLNRGE